MYRKLKISLKFWWQRRTRGFDDSELWSLDHTIIEFIYPRLKAFYESNKLGYPCDFEVDDDPKGDKASKLWDAALEKMVWSMKHHSETEGFVGWDKDVEKHNQKLEDKFNEGWELFCQHFFSMWD